MGNVYFLGPQGVAGPPGPQGLQGMYKTTAF